MFVPACLQMPVAPSVLHYSGRANSLCCACTIVHAHVAKSVDHKTIILIVGKSVVPCTQAILSADATGNALDQRINCLQKHFQLLYPCTVCNNATSLFRHWVTCAPALSLIWRWIFGPAFRHNYATKKIPAPILCRLALRQPISGRTSFGGLWLGCSPQFGDKTHARSRTRFFNCNPPQGIHVQWKAALWFPLR